MDTTEFKNRVLSLSERIYPMVARMLGNSHNAQDAVQVIMIKLWSQRNRIENHSNIDGFVFLTARNYCLDVLKKKQPNVLAAESQFALLNAQSGFEKQEWLELKGIVEEILKGLPDLQREVMIMRDIDGLEFLEIAEIKQLQIEHVRVLLSRARKYVSVELRKKYCYERGE